MSEGYDDIRDLPYDESKTDSSSSSVLDLVLGAHTKSASEPISGWRLLLVLTVAYILTNLPFIDFYLNKWIGGFLGGKETLQSRLAVLTVKLIIFIGVYYLLGKYV